MWKRLGGGHSRVSSLIPNFFFIKANSSIIIFVFIQAAMDPIIASITTIVIKKLNNVVPPKKCISLSNLLR
jgi:hypothetical protein